MNGDIERWARPKIRFAPDSLLEGRGFELPVPCDRAVSEQGWQLFCNVRRFGAAMNSDHACEVSRFRWVPLGYPSATFDEAHGEGRFEDRLTHFGKPKLLIVDEPDPLRLSLRSRLDLLDQAK